MHDLAIAGDQRALDQLVIPIDGQLLGFLVHERRDEIQDVLGAQGLDIDMRHLKLAADAMTNTGVIKGVTRMGIIAQKSSILARATFETPVKQFVNATIKGSKDKLTSVIENIILNQPVPIGTGLPGLLVKVIGPLTKREDELKKAKKEIVKKVGK